MILAIDPGPVESAFVFWDGKKIEYKNKINNFVLLGIVESHAKHNAGNIVIEMIASYGMPVGEDVFNTCVWIGRFIQCFASHSEGVAIDLIKRIEVKKHLCKSAQAKDSNIITALVDRFDPDRKFGKHGKGTKKNPGFFYGFSKDIWQAFALAVTYYDLNHKQ